jgi:cell division protease FtsH
MVTVYGMSERVGALGYDGDGPGHAGYSEETARLIDSEARRLAQEAERLARRVLEGSRGELQEVAQALLEHETLMLEDLERILGAVR